MAVTVNTKIIRCCHCNGAMRVSAKAMSVFCPHCHKRAPIESLRITGSHPGRTLYTCGDIYVEPTARLNLEIFATRIIIQGRVNGNIRAAEAIEIGPTGHVVGDLKAPKIVVQEGGKLEGRLNITRVQPLASAAPDAT